MGRETILFKSEEKVSRSQAADLLRRLADKVEKGRVSLSQGKEKVDLKLPGNVEVEVKAEKEVGKRRTKKKIEVEIEWLVGASGADAPLKIG
jgi:amphi-Trp domain-containing protein